MAGAKPVGSIAVIFVSRRTAVDQGYAEAARRMLELAESMPGYLGVDSARGDDGLGITVSYWESEAAVAAWRADVEHLEAQRLGRTKWYEHFDLHVTRVIRSKAYDA